MTFAAHARREAHAVLVGSRAAAAYAARTPISRGGRCRRHRLGLHRAHAALQTARGGRHTLVVDAEEAGFGCSTRNGGQISTSIKPSLRRACAATRASRAFGIMQGGPAARSPGSASSSQSEGIDCDFRVVGRFHAAHNPASVRGAGAADADQPKGLEVRGACRAARRAAHRARHRRLLWRRGLPRSTPRSIRPDIHQGLLERAIARRRHSLARTAP